MLGDRSKLFETYGQPLLDPSIRLAFLRKAGIAYGLIFSLGFALVFWVPDALQLQQASGYLPWAKLIIGLILCLPIGGLTGWLAIRARWSLVSALIWTLGGGVIGWVAGHVPYEGLNAITGLDQTLPFTMLPHPFYLFAAGLTLIGVAVGMIAGFLIGLFELIVVEWAWDRSTAGHRLGVRSILALCACLPIAGLFALYADSVMQAPIREPIIDMAWTIDRVLATGSSIDRTLTSFEPFRAQMSERYTIYWNGVESTGGSDLSDVVDVAFDSGLKLHCRFVGSTVQSCVRQ
jgi:hypothetical protein